MPRRQRQTAPATDTPPNLALVRPPTRIDPGLLAPWDFGQEDLAAAERLRPKTRHAIEKKFLIEVRHQTEKLRRDIVNPQRLGPDGGMLMPLTTPESRVNDWLTRTRVGRRWQADPAWSNVSRRSVYRWIIHKYSSDGPGPRLFVAHLYNGLICEHENTELVVEHLFAQDDRYQFNLDRRVVPVGRQRRRQRRAQPVQPVAAPVQVATTRERLFATILPAIISDPEDLKWFIRKLTTLASDMGLAL